MLLSLYLTGCAIAFGWSVADGWQSRKFSTISIIMGSLLIAFLSWIFVGMCLRSLQKNND